MMNRRTIDKNKSPLHPSALRINDLTIGRRYITFNTTIGIIESGIILSRPYFGHLRMIGLSGSSGQRHLVVDALEDTGFRTTTPLSDKGVDIYTSNGAWNPTNFTIDARKIHLLPKVLLPPRYHSRSRNGLSSSRYERSGSMGDYGGAYEGIFY